MKNLSADRRMIKIAMAAPYLERAGFGTERVEEQLAEAFPNARIARVDRDSVRRKGALASLLGRFAGGERACDDTARMVTIINPPDLPRPQGYSHGVIAQGRLVFVAGQIGCSPNGALVGLGFVEQFNQALANVLTVVRAAGGSPESVVRLTIFVTDRAEYVSARVQLGERYRAHMGRHFPAMTLIEVRSLLEPGAVVEIEATAVIAAG